MVVGGVVRGRVEVLLRVIRFVVQGAGDCVPHLYVGVPSLEPSCASRCLFALFLRLVCLSCALARQLHLLELQIGLSLLDSMRSLLLS